MKEEKIVEDLAEVLARTYKKINWRKIGVKNSHDYSIGRLRMKWKKWNYKKGVR